MKIIPLAYGYTPVGDLITLCLCISNYFFLRSTYAPRKKNLYLFLIANANLSICCITSILYFSFMAAPNPAFYIIICALGVIRRTSLMSIFIIFCQYLCNLVRMQGKLRQLYDILSYGISSILLLLIFFFSIKENTLVYMGLDYKVHNNIVQTFFGLEYLLNMLLLTSIVLLYRGRIITKIRHCIISLVMLSFVLIFLSSSLQSSSYICLSFYFPVLGALFLFHHNAFDVSTGALDRNSLKGYLRDIKGSDFYLICLSLKELPEEKIPNLNEYMFRFNEEFFRYTCTFRIKENKFIMILPAKHNLSFYDKFYKMESAFEGLYEYYHIPYKFITLREDGRFKDETEYLDFLRILENNIEWNTIHQCNVSDIDIYIDSLRVYEVLGDIDASKNYNDERVKVYCQPVFETQRGIFTTAEALMRIETPKTGVIYPDLFIPIAERNGYIHTLSLIILYKTCRQIVEFEKQGLHIERVSVNFSVLELRSKFFCDDIINIINDVGVSPSKIAIELTESRNDNDFAMVKSKITMLHEYGIKFYLDDFGTGYSNFERILELPIDIIKFDRSLTNLAGANEISKYMVKNFSKIFIQSNYEILFEGIETQNDEELCKEMKAKYLQGYKYSKPIPISQLADFLEKENGGILQ